MSWVHKRHVKKNYKIVWLDLVGCRCRLGWVGLELLRCCAGALPAVSIKHPPERKWPTRHLLIESLLSSSQHYFVSFRCFPSE